jgi:uncharacterized protein YukE
MTPSPTGRIRVEPAELDALARKLAAVRSDLANAWDTFETGDDLKSVFIEQALMHFTRTWSKHRSDLIKLLNGAEHVLHAASDRFQQADAQLAAGLNQSGA